MSALAPTRPLCTCPPFIVASGLWQQMERKIYFDMLTVGYEVPPAPAPAPASTPTICLPTLDSVYRPTN